MGTNKDKFRTRESVKSRQNIDMVISLHGRTCKTEGKAQRKVLNEQIQRILAVTVGAA
ncbi:hypothetical protein GUITHDRAFT_155171, partial [Guillardia theta CCMP2712]